MHGSLSNVTNFQDSVSTSAVNSKPVHSQRLSAKPFAMKCSMYSPFVQAFWHKKCTADAKMDNWCSTLMDPTISVYWELIAQTTYVSLLDISRKLLGSGNWGDWECGMRVLLESACSLKDKYDQHNSAHANSVWQWWKYSKTWHFSEELGCVRSGPRPSRVWHGHVLPIQANKLCMGKSLFKLTGDGPSRA